MNQMSFIILSRDIQITPASTAVKYQVGYFYFFSLIRSGMNEMAIQRNNELSVKDNVLFTLNLGDVFMILL